VSPDPEEVRRELEALTAQTARLDMLDLDLADDRVEYQAIVFLLEDRAALARRAGFADEQIGELAGVSPEVIAELLDR
jgi:hypothetical protein